MTDDAYAFWRYEDLIERRIVNSRTDLHNKQADGFPKAVKLGSGKAKNVTALFPRGAVRAWVDQRLGRLPDESAADAEGGGKGTGHQRGHAGGDADSRGDSIRPDRSRNKARDAALRSR